MKSDSVANKGLGDLLRTASWMVDERAVKSPVISCARLRIISVIFRAITPTCGHHASPSQAIPTPDYQRVPPKDAQGATSDRGGRKTEGVERSVETADHIHLSTISMIRHRHVGSSIPVAGADHQLLAQISGGYRRLGHG
jgi:hypothetical protein